jgi:hypothetical protein
VIPTFAMSGCTNVRPWPITCRVPVDVSVAAFIALAPAGDASAAASTAVVAVRRRFGSLMVLLVLGCGML